MKFRRNGKRDIVTLHQMLSSHDMTAQNRADVIKKLEDIENYLREGEPEYDQEEVDRRRQILSSNPGLYDIFNSMWMTVAMLTDSNNCLTRTGYVRFQMVLQKALGAHANDQLTRKSAEDDWEHDTEVYGPISRTIFFDLLFEIIETYTVFVDPMYYSAFAWALLDAVAELNVMPPKLRPFRTVSSILKTSNEAALLNSFYNPEAKRERAALKLNAEFLERVPEVQKRLAGRREATGFVSDEQLEMIAAMARLIKMDTSGRDETLTDSEEEEKEEKDEDEDGSDVENNGNYRDGKEGENNSIPGNGKRSYFKLRKVERKKLFDERSAWMAAGQDRDLVGNEGDRPKTTDFADWLAGGKMRPLDRHSSVSSPERGGHPSGPTDSRPSSQVQSRPKSRLDSRGSYRFYRDSSHYMTQTESSSGRIRSSEGHSKTRGSVEDNSLSSCAETEVQVAADATWPRPEHEVAQATVVIGTMHPEGLDDSRPQSGAALEDDPEYQELMKTLGQVTEKDRLEKQLALEAERAAEEIRRNKEEEKQQQMALTRLARQERENTLRAREAEDRKAAQEKIHSFYEEVLSRELVITPAKLKRQELVRDAVGQVPAIRPLELSAFPPSSDGLSVCNSLDAELAELYGLDDNNYSKGSPISVSPHDSVTGRSPDAKLVNSFAAGAGESFFAGSKAGLGSDYNPFESTVQNTRVQFARKSQSLSLPGLDEQLGKVVPPDTDIERIAREAEAAKLLQSFPHEAYSDVIKKIVSRTGGNPSWSHRRAFGLMKKPVIKITREERASRDLMALELSIAPRGRLGRSKHSILHPYEQPPVLTKAARSRLEIAARFKIMEESRPLSDHGQGLDREPTMNDYSVVCSSPFSDEILTRPPTGFFPDLTDAIAGTLTEQDVAEAAAMRTVASLDDELSFYSSLNMESGATISLEMASLRASKVVAGTSHIAMKAGAKDHFLSFVEASQLNTTDSSAVAAHETKSFKELRPEVSQAKITIRPESSSNVLATTTEFNDSKAMAKVDGVLLHMQSDADLAKQAIEKPRLRKGSKKGPKKSSDAFLASVLAPVPFEPSSRCPPSGQSPPSHPKYASLNIRSSASLPALLGAGGTPIKIVLEKQISDISELQRDRDSIEELKATSGLPLGVSVPSYPPAVEAMKLRIASSLSGSVSPDLVGANANRPILPVIASPTRALSPPWLMPGSLDEMDCNKSNKLLAWSDRKLLMQYGNLQGWNRAKVVHSVMRQEGIRQRFEDFTVTSQLSHLPNDPQFVQFKHAATMSKSVLAGAVKKPHAISEKWQELGTVKHKDKLKVYSNLKPPQKTVQQSSDHERPMEQ